MSFELLFFAIFAGGWLAGRLFDFLRLPSVLGMTLWGMGLAFLSGFLPAASPWPAGFNEVVPFIKSFALVVILLRAGLGISRKDLRAAGIPALLMGFVPCLVEGFALTATFMLLFGFSWEVAGLTGFMLAAVSPAVVVPSMLELKSRGLGKKNGVLTVVLAGASGDDVCAITVFTLFLGLAKITRGASPEPIHAMKLQDAAMAGLGSTPHVTAAAVLPSGSPGPEILHAIEWIPVSLAGGLALGLGAGFLVAWWFRRRHQAIRATEKTVLLLASAILLVQLGNWLQVAALLGIMAMGLVLVERAGPVAQELASKLGKIWIAAQIALFVIIGLSIDLPTALSAGPRALLALGIGLLARSTGVMLSTLPSRMNWKERLFCAVAYLPKATVQAALGGLALSAGLPEGKTILAIAVLSILVTAPLGLLGIRAARNLLE